MTVRFVVVGSKELQFVEGWTQLKNKYARKMLVKHLEILKKNWTRDANESKAKKLFDFTLDWRFRYFCRSWQRIQCETSFFSIKSNEQWRFCVLEMGKSRKSETWNVSWHWQANDDDDGHDRYHSSVSDSFWVVDDDDVVKQTNEIETKRKLCVAEQFSGGRKLTKTHNFWGAKRWLCPFHCMNCMWRH